MSDTDSIPDTFLNKSQISVKYGMSRVTINKHLKALEASGRLIPTIVKQGNRKLYRYDPADLDVAFASLNSTSKNNKNVQSIVFNDKNVKLQTENELLSLNLQNAEKRLLEKDEQISDLKDQRDLKDRQIEVLQSLITDQRPNSASEPIKEEVVPPKPSTVAEIKEAVADADKSNVGLTNVAPKEQPESPPEEHKQPTEAPTAKEARRDNIAPKPEPQQYEKPRGLWAWLKGY